MTVTVTTSPPYPSAGMKVRLVGTSSAYSDDDIEWSLTSAPDRSTLALGLVVERPPSVARTKSVVLAYHARRDLARPIAAAITRAVGSFVADGYVVGMALDITGTANNNKRVTIAAVSSTELTLSLADDLVAETVSSSLVGGEYGQGGSATNEFVPDFPGEYTFEAYEYFTWPGTGGAYAGDPLGTPQKRLISKATTTVYVGEQLDLPIEPVNGHGSTLRIFVVNETVRNAELVNPRTDLARIAALDTTVAAAVSALSGVAVSGIDVDFITDTNDLCAAYEAHRVLTGGAPFVHNGADTVNALLRESANSIPSALDRLNDFAAKIIGHEQALSSGGTWHNTDDGKNILQVAPNATTLGQGIVLKADLRERVYERHRVQVTSPAAHTLSDNTNVMSAPLTLPSAIVAYLDFIADNAPTVPAGESQGSGDAQAAWGFSRI